MSSALELNPFDPDSKRSSPNPGASKALRSLSDLMHSIAATRSQIQAWETALLDLNGRLRTDLLPLEKKMLEIRIETFRTLGKHLQSGWLSKRDRKTLELAFLDFARELEDRFEVDLTQDRKRFLDSEYYSDYYSDHGDEEENDSSSPTEYLEGPESSSFHERDFQETPTGSNEKKGIAAPSENRADGFAGDIRALYLMLARALHPDKEGDPLRRQEKTVWMQKVAAAYGNRDLAGLLDILGRNPMDALGPYLSEAPLKTVNGFAKRLRRDLAVLQNQILTLKAGLDPFFAALIKDGKVNETAYLRHLAEVKKDVKFMKQRRESYATSQGVQELIQALRMHNWHELM
jgi:hypothetical protein